MMGVKVHLELTRRRRFVGTGEYKILACGNSTARRTTDIAEVTCAQCKSTRAYRAMQRQSEVLKGESK